MDFLGIKDKTYLVFGVANKKSVAYFVSKTLIEFGAKVLFVVKDDDIKTRVQKLFSDATVYTCDVEKEEEITSLYDRVSAEHKDLSGILHSIAFANFSEGIKPFHETKREDFLQAINISCFSLISISNAFKDLLTTDASIVTISISTTTMAAESYGYMGPVKGALDSAICFLAKSFSNFSNVRFNAVAAGLLKTSASAGIPGYIDYYLYSEKLTLRKKALSTQEVANTALFLLSERSSGINAQKVVIDAGMATNYFDKDVIGT
ncbi:enoyl-ACP reductase [Thermodesulfobacteriota bacterium]